VRWVGAVGGCFGCLGCFGLVRWGGWGRCGVVPVQIFDFNNDKVLSRSEFRSFCEMFFPDVTKKVARDIFIALVITPCLIWFSVEHIPLIKHILPEAVIGAFIVSILNATGAFRCQID